MSARTLVYYWVLCGSLAAVLAWTLALSIGLFSTRSDLLFSSLMGGVLGLVLTLYLYIVIARALVSWVNPDPRNPIVRFLYNATEPLLYRVRRVVPYMGGIDFSPLVVIIGIYFLQGFLVASLMDLAYRLH